MSKEQHRVSNLCYRIIFTSCLHDASICVKKKYFFQSPFQKKFYLTIKKTFKKSFLLALGNPLISVFFAIFSSFRHYPSRDCRSQTVIPRNRTLYEAPPLSLYVIRFKTKIQICFRFKCKDCVDYMDCSYLLKNYEF